MNFEYKAEKIDTVKDVRAQLLIVKNLKEEMSDDPEYIGEMAELQEEQLKELEELLTKEKRLQTEIAKHIGGWEYRLWEFKEICRREKKKREQAAA